jgi:L-ornithine Nalpha-acyltransferase
MSGLGHGRYRVHRAATLADLHRAQHLRHLCFRGGSGLDADAHDAGCDHYLIEDGNGELAACFRVKSLMNGAELVASYAAQFYDLAALAAYPLPMLELGRFCIRPDARDPDILRLGWGVLTGLVDRLGVGMMFGCTSFRGTDPAEHAEALALLGTHYIAPAGCEVGRRAAEVVVLERRPHDLRRAQAGLPPLLRSYLAMGGWVSDHAVIDRDLGTMHVFTALDIAGVPAARARSLRAVAG